jgi:thiamine pyrophosphokinase
MSAPALKYQTPVILVGAGAFDRAMLDEARAHGGPLIAADGAADRLAGMGLAVDAAIGDLDSIGDAGRSHARRLVGIAEQDTTDFEKCLYATEAPLYVGVGFTGARVDHTLANLHVMLARPDKRVVLLGETDALTLAPAGRELRLALGMGARVSIFPLGEVQGVSQGLEWPIEGLTFAPGHRIGTSNRASADDVTLRFGSAGAVLVLERHALGALIEALRQD